MLDHLFHLVQRNLPNGIVQFQEIALNPVPMKPPSKTKFLTQRRQAAKFTQPTESYSKFSITFHCAFYELIVIRIIFYHVDSSAFPFAKPARHRSRSGESGGRFGVFNFVPPGRRPLWAGLRLVKASLRL